MCLYMTLRRSDRDGSYAFVFRILVPADEYVTYTMPVLGLSTFLDWRGRRPWLAVAVAGFVVD